MLFVSYRCPQTEYMMLLSVKSHREGGCQLYFTKVLLGGPECNGEMDPIGSNVLQKMRVKKI